VVWGTEIVKRQIAVNAVTAVIALVVCSAVVWTLMALGWSRTDALLGAVIFELAHTMATRGRAL
jgi:hypothetical protein